MTSNAWSVLRRSLAPLARLDLWLICRSDLTKPLPPCHARVPIEVKPASGAELEQAARLDGGGESYAGWLRSWVRAGNACFVAKVGSEVVARGLLGTGNLHFEDYCIVLGDGEVYLTGGYTAEAWRGRRIHLELEYRRMLAAQQAGARAAYTLVSVDNTRSMRNSFRTGYEAAGLVLGSKAGRSGSPRVWRLRGSLHPIRLAGQTPMDQLLADNDVFEFEGCLLVVPRREPRLFLLNPTARMMWQELARGVAPDDVADALAARFDVPPAQVRADMTAILAEWSAHNLLTGAPPPDGAAPSAGPASRRRPEPGAREPACRAGLSALRPADPRALRRAGDRAGDSSSARARRRPVERPDRHGRGRARRRRLPGRVQRLGHRAGGDRRGGSGPGVRPDPRVSATPRPSGWR